MTFEPWSPEETELKAAWRRNHYDKRSGARNLGGFNSHKRPQVIFINERCRVDYESMPVDVRESADQAIDALQNARPLPAKLCQSLHAKLSGITEIRLAHDDNTYRV